MAANSRTCHTATRVALASRRRSLEQVADVVVIVVVVVVAVVLSWDVVAVVVDADVDVALAQL